MHQITTVGVHEVAWRITLRDWSGTVQDLSSVQVKVAFTATGQKPSENPADPAWHTGEWVSPGYLTVLVGGDIELAAGSYDEWVWPQDTPLKPGMQVGTLVVT